MDLRKVVNGMFRTPYFIVALCDPAITLRPNEYIANILIVRASPSFQSRKSSRNQETVILQTVFLLFMYFRRFLKAHGGAAKESSEGARGVHSLRASAQRGRKVGFLRTGVQDQRGSGYFRKAITCFRQTHSLLSNRLHIRRQLLLRQLLKVLAKTHNGHTAVLLREFLIIINTTFPYRVSLNASLQGRQCVANQLIHTHYT